LNAFGEVRRRREKGKNIGEEKEKREREGRTEGKE
jgi:hypothetical protein